MSVSDKPHITCGRDGEAYTIHIDGQLRGKYATPEMMQVHLAGLIAGYHPTLSRQDLREVKRINWFDGFWWGALLGGLFVMLLYLLVSVFF